MSEGILFWMFTDGVIRWDDERLANFQDTALKG